MLPMKNYKFSFYNIVTPVIEELNEEPTRILFSSRSGKSMLINDKIYQKVIQKDFSELQNKILSELIYNEILVEETEVEFDEILRQNAHSIKDDKNLDITIQPTANCQFGCHYCGQVHSKKHMNDEIVSKTLSRIKHNLKQKNYQSLSIEWYGGEPLMAHNQIISMSKDLIAYCDKNKLRYFAEMITNGLIFKKALFKKLVECKITHYQITLDGLTEIHDKRRILKSGGGTFDVIFKNILEVVNSQEFEESKSSITLRINIDKDNASSVCDLIDYFSEHNLQSKRVSVDFVGVVNWGDNMADKNSLNDKDFADKRIDWILYAIKKGFKYGDILPQRIAGPCMVVKDNAEVYDAFGNIYPCYEFPYTPKYEKPEYKIGHLNTIDKTINQNAITRNWYSDIKTDISTCKQCNLFPVCGGGCPKMWYNGERACPSFKSNFEDILLLDYILKKDESQEMIKSLNI